MKPQLCTGAKKKPKQTVQQLPTYASLAFSSLAPAAVTVWSMHPSNVAFRGLLCRGLQMRGGQWLM